MRSDLALLLQALVQPRESLNSSVDKLDTKLSVIAFFDEVRDEGFLGHLVMGAVFVELAMVLEQPF